MLHDTVHRCRSLCVSVCPESGKSVTVVIGDHRGTTWLPAGGADLSVLVSVLEGLDHTEDLVNVPADGQVVDAVLAESAFFVDDVRSAEGDTSVVTILDQASILLGDLLGDVGDHGDAHGTETTALSWLHGVLTVGEVRVDGAADDLSVDGFEFGALVIELADLSGAHEREVQRPEEEHDVLAFIIRKIKLGFSNVTFRYE